MSLTRLALPALLAFITAFYGCQADRTPAAGLSGVTIVFKHGKLASGTGMLGEVLREFETRMPGLRVREELLPASTDQQHQFFAMNLEGQTPAFDVLAADVIWVQEFAKAGWIRNVDLLLPARERDQYFPSAIEAVSFQDHLYAVPWYVDAGMLYYRRDLLERHGLTVPRTWEALVQTARTILDRERDPALKGFVWPGKQYEGLVCVALEMIWSHGGHLAVDNDPGAVAGLTFMRALIGPGGVSPALVTTADEEASRYLFSAGHAIFMRNWPYAWPLTQREGSPVRGKVGLSPLPASPGVPTVSVLGGWTLAIPRQAAHPREAEALIRYLSLPETQRLLTQTMGYEPPRRALYRDPSLLADHPWLADVLPVMEAAKPRPVTPYYLMLSEILQPELSAALVGTKSPEAALSSARRQMARLLGDEGKVL